MVDNTPKESTIDAKEPAKHPNQYTANKPQVKQSQQPPQKHTIVRESITRKEYAKVGIPFPYSIEEDRKETFERQTKGNWTRKVTAITWIRDLDENEFLDWNEERTGYTDMKRKITLPFNHIGQYEIPIPSERVEYDPDNEENKLVVDERPQEIQTAYHCTYSEAKLKELIDDCNVRSCEFAIKQDGQRGYTVTKKEIEKYAGNFDELYTLKSDPAASLKGK